jgi:putative restriction endonuclease
MRYCQGFACSPSYLEGTVLWRGTLATGGKLSNLTDASAVGHALAEFRRLGRQAFIDDYGFKRSRDYFVIEGGIGYDSKPVLAAAYGHQHGRKQALHYDDFSGGGPVITTFGRLGYRVVRWTSPQLEEGAIYTRERLREMFVITDATINNGIFRPKDTSSIWLFVTSQKTKDRTPYKDIFEGDLLHWQGQLAGRRDQEIVAHEAAGVELIVFYRLSKREYPGAGFRFEGKFRYVQHTGSKPTTFLLQRLGSRDDAEVPETFYDPTSIEDGRQKTWAAIKRRQGQPAFRRNLLRAYGGRCAITGCAIEPLLEAAHIVPYRGPKTNDVRNGLLLRADIHTLFDVGAVRIDPDGKVRLVPSLHGTEYGALHGQQLRMPELPTDHPSQRALAWHRAQTGSIK